MVGFSSRKSDRVGIVVVARLGFLRGRKSLLPIISKKVNCLLDLKFRQTPEKNLGNYLCAFGFALSPYMKDIIC